MSNLFRLLPAVDLTLDALETMGGFGHLPRPLVRDLVNAFFDLCREDIKSGKINDSAQLDSEVLMPRLARFLRRASKPHFRRVLNATGVVVHTNMGRSLLAKDAVAAVVAACAHYSNLEFDLGTGERGSRYAHVEELLCRLTGAEAALVVNNNAAAVFIILDTLAKGREVVVSRGQLVEIGGSFRIPDVMARSGAHLKEVGTTNRTHLRDYEQAINENTAMLMKVHTSNFRVIGFTKEVGLAELKELGEKRGLPVYEDLGSGSLFDFSGLGLLSEPTVTQVVEDGADICSFSGDKVLGGPQAGIIVGAKKYLDRIKRNPLNRALRIDKMILAALEATLRLYLDPDLAAREVPTLAMIGAGPRSLKTKAIRLAAQIKKTLGSRVEISVRKGVSRVGGGAFPEQDLPTSLVALCPRGLQSVDALKAALLKTDPPLVGRIEWDAFCLDPRTLALDEFKLVVEALGQALE